MWGDRKWSTQDTDTQCATTFAGVVGQSLFGCEGKKILKEAVVAFTSTKHQSHKNAILCWFKNKILPKNNLKTFETL